jgi:hypothetical protein
MNSEQLKEQYNKDYENFFRNNSKVISLPLLINWSWWLWDNYKWLKIKQKIPLRIYVWINKIKDPKIKFNNIHYFDILEEKFIKYPIMEYAPFFYHYYKFLKNEYLDDILIKWWLEINILSETSRWLWLGFISISFLWLILCFEDYYYWFNTINNKQKLMESLNIKNSINKILKKSIKYNINTYNSNKWEINIFIENQISSFFDSKYPIISFSEDINYKNDININNIKLFWYKLNELSNLPYIPFIPIDHGIIYSWKPVLVDHIINSDENSITWTGDIKTKLNNFFTNDLEELFPSNKPKFYKHFIDTKDDIIKENYWDLMWSISLELLNTMLKIYSNKYTESSLTNFIEAIDKVRFWNYISRKSSHTFKNFISNIRSYFKSNTKVIWISPNDTTIMWWTINFVLPLEWFRKDIIESIKKTKEKINWVTLIYSSWLDWNMQTWFKVEQDLKKWIYSKFLDNTYELIHFDKKTTIWQDELLSFLLNTNWIILNKIDNKIYIDWKKLTSKNLVSQNTTIEIVEKLINNIWKDISNKNLSVSSYSQNKNEINTKIIKPFIKLIKSKKWIELKINIIWDRTNFILNMEPIKINIYIIKERNIL